MTPPRTKYKRLTMAERRRKFADLGYEQLAEAVADLRSAAGYFTSAAYPEAADTYERIAAGIERDIAERRTGRASPLPPNAHDDPVQTGERVRGRRASGTLPTSTPKTGDTHE